MSTKIDSDNQLHIHPFNNGIKLITPEIFMQSKKRWPAVTIKTVFDQSYSAYIINNNLLLQSINTACADICGFDSEESAKGKSAFDFADFKSAEHAVRFDKQTLCSKKICINEQTLKCNDGREYELLSIRSPLYNIDNKIVGLIGYSIDLSQSNLAKSLNKIVELGLLNVSHDLTNKIKSNAGNDVDNIYLSKRQIECAKLILEGLSARLIAVNLNLSKRTVETYIENIKIKLKCKNKTDLILKLSKFCNFTQSEQF